MSKDANSALKAGNSQGLPKIDLKRLLIGLLPNIGRGKNKAMEITMMSQKLMIKNTEEIHEYLMKHLCVEDVADWVDHVGCQ